MKRPPSIGACHLCQGTFNKTAMTRHLAKCINQHAPAAGSGKAKAKKTRLFHLVVEGRYNPQYWLHLEVPATATLADLDGFLRDTWLECCDHLSQFTIEGVRYSVTPEPDIFGFGFENEDMEAGLGNVLRPGLKFAHEYDFGSTTELTLKVVGEREGPARKKDPVRILARNNPPEIPCGKCGKPATQVDMEDAWEETGWLCDACAGKSGQDESMFLPVVNSPRVGVCGYTGQGF
jgi:hypothetical protein